VSSSVVAALCCCGGPPPAAQVRIDIVRTLSQYQYLSRLYAPGYGAADICDDQTGLPPYSGATEVDFACTFNRVHGDYVQRPDSPSRYWNLCDEVVHGESTWTASHSWVLPYTASRTVYSSGIWRMMTSGGVVTTTVSAFIQQTVDDYALTEDLPAIVGTGDACSNCSTETGTPAPETVTASYTARGTYQTDMVAFQCYADSVLNSGWTIEFTALACVVKDGPTVKYSFPLASYTIKTLRDAIGATAELSALGGLAVNGSVGGQSAALIPVQGPMVVGTSSSPASVKLRTAGQTFEDYQTFGYPTYEVRHGSDTPVEAAAPAFQGTESQFATGFEIYWTTAEIRSGANMTDWDGAGAVPTSDIALSGPGDCTSGGLPVAPPIYVEPSCAGTGVPGLDSIPTTYGYGSLHGYNIRARTGAAQEFRTGGETFAYWAADSSSCGGGDALYRCAGYTGGTCYGKVCQWMLTRT